MAESRSETIRFESNWMEKQFRNVAGVFFSAASLKIVGSAIWLMASVLRIYLCLCVSVVFSLRDLLLLLFQFVFFFWGANFKWKLLCYEWTRNTVFHLSPLSFFSFWIFVERKHTFPFDWLNGKGVNIYRFLIAANKQPERAVKNKRKS